ncbi:MAG: response regulator transcription factor [Bacteroidota bacterium]|nr:response regulator transcription factor [Bacteroidota bacterium]
MDKIRVFLADDHAVLRDGLKVVINTDPDLVVVGEAEDGESVLPLAKCLNPDILILDINMPKMNGIEAAKLVKAELPNIKILMLTMHDNENYIFDALSVGINGYISKNSDMDELLKAIKTIAHGEEYFPPYISNIIIQNYLTKAQKTTGEVSNSSLLTGREKEILVLISKGLTSHEIAEKLFISYFTVGKHRKNLMKKLKLKNTAELVNYAIKEGLV